MFPTQCIDIDFIKLQSQARKSEHLFCTGFAILTPIEEQVHDLQKGFLIIILHDKLF